MSHATVAISGTIGRDVRVKATSNGSFLASFSVAANTNVKGQSGNYEDVATWFRVTYFSRSEKWLEQFVTGAKVFVTGEIYQRAYTDRDGNKGTSLEVTASHAESLSPRQDAPQQQRPASPQQQARYAPEPDFNDDVPF